MNKPAKRERADKILVERGLAESRTRAQAMIMAGSVFIGEQRVDKPGDIIPIDADVVARGQEHPWVSRGGMKLDHGLRHFSIDPTNCICIDVGASTGGFTDVLLQNGAAKVYAVDVGRGQLGLEVAPRRTRYRPRGHKRPLSDRQQIPKWPTSSSAMRVSSDSKILPASLALAKPRAKLIALIKPQFQAGRKDVGKGGVVRDAAIHQRVCDEVCAWLEETGWRPSGITESPIKGPKGNAEFLAFAQRNTD